MWLHVFWMKFKTKCVWRLKSVQDGKNRLLYKWKCEILNDSVVIYENCIIIYMYVIAILLGGKLALKIEVINQSSTVNALVC